MSGYPAAAGGDDASLPAPTHLSVVQPEVVDKETADATIIEIAPLRPASVELESIIYAW
jgi:hypothetical protein